MHLTQHEYDQLPLAARMSALILWGTHLESYSRSGRFRLLYSLNNFFAELCFDEQQLRPTYVCTFSDTNRLEPYLTNVNWQDMLV